ncbi:DsbA family protein [Deefgea piscis]|uniref:DsbA family protein n=1 Tax=Deefgea piscis TaxID=2739061 RepID=A0A6M8SQJ2_9NEIS|nr:DsbA family protein [Deefgea piscis]QKJ66384.1 DsbA family protein [Deefgea piscis]
MVKRLDYYFDPLCGWCYAAAPLLQALAEQSPEIEIVLHAGGMMSGERRQYVTPALRDYVMPHDQRIAALSGQVFSPAYFDGLLRNSQAVFDSTPPTLAIFAAAALGGSALKMLEKIQQAHYQQGRQIADFAVLLDLAAELDFTRPAFEQAMQHEATTIAAHFAQTQQDMAQHDLRGFPSLRFAEGAAINLGPFLAQPDAFVAWIRQQTPVSLLTDDAAFCSPQGCEPKGI